MIKHVCLIVAVVLVVVGCSKAPEVKDLPVAVEQDSHGTLISSPLNKEQSCAIEYEIVGERPTVSVAVQLEKAKLRLVGLDSEMGQEPTTQRGMEYNRLPITMKKGDRLTVQKNREDVVFFLKSGKETLEILPLTVDEEFYRQEKIELADTETFRIVAHGDVKLVSKQDLGVPISPASTTI